MGGGGAIRRNQSCAKQADTCSYSHCETHFGRVVQARDHR